MLLLSQSSKFISLNKRNKDNGDRMVVPLSILRIKFMTEINYEQNLIKSTDIFSLYPSENNEYLQNIEAVERLKNECDLLAKATTIGTVISSWLALLPLLPVPISLVGLVGMSLAADYLTRVHRVYFVAKMLLDNFGDDGIQITPKVKTNSAIIDLFIRMPDKRIFVLMIRGAENTSIRWREDAQNFFVTKKGNSRRSDPLGRVIEKLNTVTDLKKEKSPLMGVTSAERNTPIIKAIVVAPGAKISAGNSPELWTNFGEARVIRVKTTSVTYVVECEDLVKFLLPPKK
jgi:hypothetical protein